MRLALPLSLFLTAPAQAWEFSPQPICTLTHDSAHAAVRLTYDPAGPLYAITLTRRTGPWPEAPAFSIRFDGPRGMTISTNRHVLGDSGAALTVTDSGFDNVLDGLEFNTTATATAGDQSVALPLKDAAPAVRAFRACTVAPSV